MANETAYLYVIHQPERVFTAVVGETVQAGDFVKATDNDDAVSAASGYAPSDINVSVCDANGGDDQFCVGIALEAATSGQYIGVAMDGVFVVKSSADIGSGIACQVSDGAADNNASVKAAGDGEEEYTIGKTLTSASADAKYMVFALNV